MITKRYRIEESLGLPVPAPGISAVAMEAAPNPRLDEILTAINDLRRITQASAGETIEAAAANSARRSPCATNSK